MKQLIQKTLHSFGAQIKRYPDLDMKRRMQIIRHFNIDTILDVGANIGYYAEEIRNQAFQGKIVSFEPLHTAFRELKIKSEKDPAWIALNYALGSEDRNDTINVSENSVSSSLLNILNEHMASAPQSRYVEKHEIEIRKLDSVFSSICTGSTHIMLKIDTQGYEKNVLDGAKGSLEKIAVLQMEMSIVPLYENEMLFREMLDYVYELGFELFSLENGFANPENGRLLQVDGIFVNRSVL